MEGGKTYNSTLSLTTLLDGEGCQCRAPTALFRERDPIFIVGYDMNIL